MVHPNPHIQRAGFDGADHIVQGIGVEPECFQRRALRGFQGGETFPRQVRRWILRVVARGETKVVMVVFPADVHGAAKGVERIYAILPDA